jgi:hypothetical protein
VTPNIVIGSGGNEAQRVADVLIPAKFLLAEPCDGKIHHHSADTYDTEAHKPPEYSPERIIH